MKIITGDILDISAGTILHQVNCRAALGGLAGALHAKNPSAFTDYFLVCDKYGSMNLGSFHEGHVNRQLSIVHVFGQVEPGANTNILAVGDALTALSKRPLLHPIYAPYKMGCGIGGGNWDEYSDLLTKAFPSIFIVKREGDE